MKNFGIIGVGGYIAPRHLKAIKETGNNLVVALDKSDSVGIMDSYFPQCSFYTEYERFDRFVEKIKHTKDRLDYVSVCTPNYLHDSHIRFGLRAGADVICEKPLVLNPWNIDALQKMEEQTGKKVYNILQLRLHPAIIEWKNMIDNGPKDKVYDVVERMPSFPGGPAALMQYLNNSIRYPEEAKANGIRGRVTVQFVVEKDGSISGVSTMRSADPMLDREAMRIVSNMPKWKPGKSNGSPVRVKYFVPVVFR